MIIVQFTINLFGIVLHQTTLVFLLVFFHEMFIYVFYVVVNHF